MNHRFLLIILVLLLFNNCEKVSIRIEPKIAILGRWEIVEIGNWPEMEKVNNSNESIEYLPDSIKIEYPADGYGFTKKNYWVDSVTLYERIYDQQEQEYFLTGIYKVTFSSNYKMRLDIRGPALFKTSIYKRIK